MGEPCCDPVPSLDSPSSSPFLDSSTAGINKQRRSVLHLDQDCHGKTDGHKGRAMAPMDVSHEPDDALLPSFVRVERRDTSQSSSTPTSTVVGFAAAIAILSAIILGYAAYRGFKWYRTRYHPSAISPNSIKSSKFKQNGIPNPNYDHLAAMSETKMSHINARHNQDVDTFSPLPQTASTVVNGPHTAHSDWRPPMLPPRSKNEHSQGGSDSAPGVEANHVERNHVDGIPYPSQTYSAKERRRGTGGVFGFMRNSANGIMGGRKSGEKHRLGAGGPYLTVNGNPPIGSPPPQFLTTANGNSRDFEGVGLEAGVIAISHAEESGNTSRRFGGAASPPLPPLPQRTSAPMDAPRQSAEKSTQSTTHSIATKFIPAPINLAPPPPSAALRPPSRAPTTKSYRLTATSSLTGHGTVPSPRVSSLFRASSRLSNHHGYTPASPGLPNPPVIPPIPALPAHLFRFPSMSKTITSTGSTDTHAKHDSAISTSTLHGGGASVEATEDPTKGPDGKPLPRTMVVTCTFTPSLSDELPLTIGETVSMLEEYIDEWCFVQRVRVMVKDGGSRTMGGVMVSVHGTVDAQNTITVQVAGEGNLGAVPRFCLSEWPIAIFDSTEEEQAVILGQETPTDLPIFTPPGFLPSPPSSSTAPTFTPGRMDVARQPLLPPTRQAQPKPAGQALRSRPLPTPTLKAPVIPDQHLDSKFSSWGSVEAQVLMPMPGAPDLGRNQNANNVNAATRLGPQAPNESLQVVPNSVRRPASSTSSQVPAAASSISSHIHPLANDSRTPSVSSAATSIAPPVVPPTSPDSQSPINGSSAEDDNIKRVSKPPLAPRISRFPPTPDEDEPLMHMHVHGHSRNPSREGGIPRAAERTVTMPPLPRRPSASDPSTTESLAPSQQQNNPIVHSSVVNISANAHWGGVFPSRDNHPPTMTPSTSADAASTGMGTSVGSKTPSTAATSTHSSPAGKGAFSKHFTAASTQVSRSGSLNNIHPATRSPMGAPSQSYIGRGPAGPEKKTGTGMINLKALRTGSSTAGVGPVGR